MKTLNEMIANRELENLSDDAVREISYGVMNFTPMRGMLNQNELAYWWAMQPILVARLATLTAAAPATAAPARVASRAQIWDDDNPSGRRTVLVF